ncbi:MULTISPECIES: glycosyltransferase family 9 protein [unclassified Gilliamella]|uniref:glycosyltransferase family 9 protein n=1 Tax=unclassified Gilliamella TaxID=2685620 RepID=UPI00226AA0E2|nr:MULTISPECIES: glycosyltransferase family 9 protein [unclassified Gilliamella]MCX8641178.1 glycosyltransferase family 9 protein [Gilliamella sp. B3835]MCX8707063.1 glycosyltransferase family 9 protein [Gilliamella sp. B3783]MCX8710440.1 glycosyltransferase family 9 protein [Gilliamella sp. B3780]MCX8715122.1 glycosyltransferase family 9 protein [Gilliamella sp. B3781]MCX8716046.1 glycosyltransferase family 9 protein [Gilliamella sp. B3784]
MSQIFLYNDKSFLELLRSIKLVRKHQFDLAIDVRFHRKLDLKNLLYCCFIRTSNLLSYNKSNIKSFNISLPYYESKAHVTNQLKYYLSYLNINFDSFDYDVFIDSQKKKRVDSFINEYVKPKSKFVVINPYGGSSYRCLSESQITKLCYLFVNNYPEYKIIIIGQDERLKKFSMKEAVKFQSPSITDVIALIKNADLVISVDTSIVHLASAFSTKCISIYMEPLPTNLENLKSFYSRQFRDYKYLQQDLFLDKNI